MSTLSDRILATSPNLWYKFDGNALDSSGNNHHGTATTVTYIAGCGDGGQAATFQQLSSRINGPLATLAPVWNGVAGGNEGSFYCWFLPDATQWMANPGVNFALAGSAVAPTSVITFGKQVTTNKVEGRRIPDGINAPAAFEFVGSGILTVSWHVVAFTWSKIGNKAELTIDDGLPISFSPVSWTDWHSILGNTLSFFVVGNTYTNNTPWKGGLQHFCWWNRSIITTEIQSISVITIPEPPPPPMVREFRPCFKLPHLKTRLNAELDYGFLDDKIYKEEIRKKE